MTPLSQGNQLTGETDAYIVMVWSRVVRAAAANAEAEGGGSELLVFDAAARHLGV